MIAAIGVPLRASRRWTQAWAERRQP